MPVRDLIIAVLLFASLPVCFFRPFFGILMWIIVGLLNPQSFMWQNAFPWALAVGSLTLAGFAIFLPSRVPKLISREGFLIFVLWCWFTFTTMHNTVMPQFASFAGDTWAKWQFVSKVLLMTLVMTAIADTRSRFRTFVLVICGCIGFIVLKSLPFMILTGGEFRIYGPRGSMLADNNDLGLVLNMTLPLFFFMARSDPNPWIRKLMWFLFAVTIPAIFFTYSRGAFLGLGVVMVYMLMRLRHRMVLIPILLLGGAFAMYLTPQQWQDRMDFRQQGTLLDRSAESRINAWTYCWRLANDYPLTGGGFEAFTPELFYRYAPNPDDVHGPHSIYFQVLAEHGFIGLGLYLCLLCSTFLSLRKVKKFASRRDDPQLRSYALMLECGLIGFLVCGAFLGRAYFDHYFTCVAGAVMLKRLCRVEHQPQHEAAVESTALNRAEPQFAEDALVRFGHLGLPINAASPS